MGLRRKSDRKPYVIGAIQVLRNAEGGGGGQIFQKKALQRCKVQRYLTLRGGGWGSNLQETRSDGRSAAHLAFW